MKKVLVSGYIGFNNFGDEAIFYALSNHLKKNNYQVSVLCANTEQVAKKYNVITYKYKCPLCILKSVLNCDILISGGGSLLQNKTSNFSLFYYLFIILLAKLFFKKVIIFSQGIEPIKGKIPELITKIILKSTNAITVRDKKSQNLLKNWGIQSDLTSDPAYSLVQDSEIQKEKAGLIVQLRAFKGIDDIFLQSLANAIINNNNEKISVLSLQDEYDLEVCKKFIDILKTKNVEAELISQKEINETIDIINKTKYMISTRLHGLIIANALQTKCFALMYDEKIKTLSEELNIANIDINNYQQSELDNKLDEFFNHHLNEVHPYRHFEWKYLDDSIKKQEKKQ